MSATVSAAVSSAGRAAGVSDLVPEHVQVLEPFVRAGVFGPSEVQLAATLARLSSGSSASSASSASSGMDDLVVLAVAVAARGPRLGHVCIELSDVSRQIGDADEAATTLPWPDPAMWAASLEASDAVADPSTYLEEPLRPLVWDGRRVYLQRYFHYETTVADSLHARATAGLHSDGLTVGGADASAVASAAPSVTGLADEVTESAQDASADASSPLSVTPASTTPASMTPTSAGSDSMTPTSAGSDSVVSNPTASNPVGADPGALDEVLDRLFGVDDTDGVHATDGADDASGDDAPDDAPGQHLQRLAAQVALTHGLAVIVGGPGTGKTHTVARLLAAAHLLAAAEGRVLQVALAAPTGKAASRMTEAVRSAVDELATPEAQVISDELADTLRGTEATTLHRLLGWAPGTRFRHHRANPLPHDLVVVDETSMVALPLMARLLDAVRPDARLVLVGDPFQLASVEAGTVLGDVVGPALDLDGPALDLDGTAAAAGEPGPLAGHVAVLRRTRRFRADSAIAALGDAIRAGDADAALEVLDGTRPDASWVRDDDSTGLAALERVLVDAGVEVVMSALAGLAPAGLDAASRVKVLAATRHRPLGLYDWSDRLEAAIAARVPELHSVRRWYVGRPIMVTANDPLTRVSNGDVGLVVARDDGPAVAFPVGDGVRYLPPSRLDRVETWWAMTIHKSQGSEFAHAVVSLPPADSPILTRELLYTAVTRAKEQVTVVGSEASLRAAIERPIARASGLRDRLWPEQ